MRAARCAELINDVAYRPEWTIKARPANFTDGPDAGPSSVVVSFLIKTVNTARECAREGYAERLTLNPKNILDASPLDSVSDVHAVIMAMIMELELHEAREFFRVKSDDFNAPYHPHRESGYEAWSEYFG